MEIVPCGRGHFYDKSQGECPQCAAERAAAANAGIGKEFWPNAGGNVVADIGPTVPVGAGVDDIPATTPVNVGQYIGETQPVSSPFTVPDNTMGTQLDDYPETRPVGLDQETNFDPIVGWLVCVSGPNRGQDYRLHTGNNRVGRNPNNDVFLQGDITVSKEDNCVIGYDNRSGKFYFAAGMGKNMVYLNGEVVYNFIELNAYDVITVGNTNLMFIPLCGEHFSWDK